MNSTNSLKPLVAAVCVFLFISGCAAVQAPPVVKTQSIAGTYHRVEKGQTLWNISKLYNIDLDALVKNNNISDTTKVEAGQMIFIPRYLTQQQPPKDVTHTEEFSWPIKGKVIAGFGLAVNNMINKGVNIQTSRNTNVTASRSGTVVFYSPNFEGFGKTVIIDHGDGFSSVYARNEEVFVKTGDTVTKGTAIAKVGQAGRDKNIYLHFEIRKGYLPQNPFFYLPLRAEKN
jgi:murein DD-endopeptidase MepM/ murein hydrolase activator NlpD